ncbi:MAG: CHRD domain-containing protein [Candidatus Tectomicrobia bacterium]|uniref:CHRD domain-containing protein n=1 Tax=Tectimicrobiota bacterium TaxID=2528274 RepID=A0A937W2V5_UNCTE|nr:CHRD domain-containing protein [Candidatus Tectomicrobia bacterium]
MLERGTSSRCAGASGLSSSTGAGYGNLDRREFASSFSRACWGRREYFADAIAHLLSGNAYVNVHTDAFRGGELRGQVVNP